MHFNRTTMRAGRWSGMALAMMSLLSVLCPLKAAEITVTIAGTLEGGGDSFPIFDVGKNLDGKPFMLVYTFDDAKGVQSPIAGCKGSASGINGDGVNSPGTAVLTVGTKSYVFGRDKNVHSAIWREIASPCSQSQITIEIHEGKEPFVNGVSVHIRPIQGRPSFRPPSLTQNPDWRAPLNTQELEAGFGSGFFIGRSGDFYHQAKSQLAITSVIVSGAKQIAFKGAR